MHLSLLSSVLAARQLIAPTISSTPLGCISVLPMPNQQSDAVYERPFTLGHGPVIVSTTGPNVLWTLGHGPVVVHKPTPPALVHCSADAVLAVSTLVTVTQGSATPTGTD